MTDFARTDFVRLTREVEVTPGTATGGARDATYFTNPSFTAEEVIDQSELETGDGNVHDGRKGARTWTATLSSELTYKLNDAEWEDNLRATWQGAAISFSGTVSINNAGTHVDSTTGPTIVGSAGDFDDFIGAEGVPLWFPAIAGNSAVNASNKGRPLIIKHVKADGSQIDLEAYNVGGTGVWAALVTQASIAAVVTVYEFLKNGGAIGVRSVNFEKDFTDIDAGSYQAWRGGKGSGFQLNWDGQGKIGTQFSYVGMDFNTEAATTIGNGTVNANAGIANRFMKGGSDLTTFYYNGVEYDGTALSGFQISATGNGNANTEVSGIDYAAGVDLGTLVVTGNFMVLHEGVKSRLAAAQSRIDQKKPLLFVVQDPDGNRYCFFMPNVMLKATGPTGGAAGSRIKPSFEFSAYKKVCPTDGAYTIVMQRMPAGT